MDKASKAIRRSGVRLKSLSGGHTDLHLVISELKDVRQAAKAFMQAQNSAAQDMLKWSGSDENRAVQDIVSQLAELNCLWTDVQKEFTENLKDYKYQFEIILEGEKHVDQARNHLTVCEQREIKLRKEIKKAAKKATPDEINQLELRLMQAERAKDCAQVEVLERIRDNELVKLARLKEGLLKISEAYIELAQKGAIIFEAQRDIAYQFPDVRGRDIHEIKYTGSGATKQTVMKAKDKVRRYQRQSCQLIPRAPPLEDPPPPYTPNYYNMDNNAPPSTINFVGSYNLNVNTTTASGYPTDCDNRHYHQEEQQQQPSVRQRAVPSSPQPEEDDIRWRTNYEDDLSGAMGGARL